MTIFDSDFKDVIQEAIENRLLCKRRRNLLRSKRIRPAVFKVAQLLQETARRFASYPIQTGIPFLF